MVRHIYIQPETLLARAEGELSVPNPEIRFGPDAPQVAVKIPVWLHVENAQSIARTATAGDVKATITAELTSVHWDMGETDDPAIPGSATTAVDCVGPGTPFQPGMRPDDPSCGYTYMWRSLPERTEDGGMWTVTAEATWTVNWEVSSPTAGELLSGSQDVTVTSSEPLEVREWSAILVDESPS